MTLDQSSKATEGRREVRSIPRAVTGVNAPVVEPQPVENGEATVTRILDPEEAMAIARSAQAQGRTPPAAADEARRLVPIPSLPPAVHAPLRLTPVVLILAQMVIDVVSVAGAFWLAYWLRFKTDITPQYAPPDNPTYATMLGVTIVTMLVTFYFSRLYSFKRGASRVDEFYKIAAAVSMGTVLTLAINSLILGDKFVYSRQILLIGWLMAIGLVTLCRILYSVAVGELRKRGVDRARVLVVGTGPTAYAVVTRLDKHRTLGYKVVGMVSDNYLGEIPQESVGRIPVLGKLSNLVEIVRREQADEVVVAMQGASDHDLRDIMTLIQDESVSVKIYPDAFQLMTQNEVSVGELSGLPLITVKDMALRGWNRRLKRAFDIFFSVLILVLTAPIMLVIALAVKLSSPGPVFFIQERVGLDGNPFRLVKFRSMRVNSDPTGWTSENDPRRTKVGAFIRRFSLDELPQFFNVLIGEMSIVGPRPEQPEYVKEFFESFYTKNPKIGLDYLRRHREKAGITGWAQINGMRGDSSIELRTAMDIYYVEHWSVLFDLKIIVRTVVAMFRGKNAY